MTPRLRPAVRALILSEGHEVLLVHFQLTRSNFWATPGGGIEPGEDHLTALRRELREEVGLHHPVIGGVIWKRAHLFPMTHWDGQSETFYLVQTPRFTPVPVMTREELLAEGVTDVRWWSLSELSASREEFAPRALASLLQDIVQSGCPSVPVEIGV